MDLAAGRRWCFLRRLCLSHLREEGDNDAAEKVDAAADAMTDDAARSGVLERMTLIIDCLGEAPGHLLLEDVVAATGLPRSTAFRLLGQLSGLGWVRQDAEGYVPGPRLAHRSGSGFEGLRAASSPVLNDLAAKTGLVAHLAVMQDGFVDYVDRIGIGADGDVPSRIGTRIFAPESTSGMAILSRLEPEEVDAIIEHSGVKRLGGRESLHRDLGDIRRRQGVAYRDGSGRPSGVSSVGVAIIGSGRPLGAISVARRGGVSPQVVGPLVLRAASAIASTLKAGASEPG